VSWLVTPNGEALPGAGTVSDESTKPPGFSKTIPGDWGSDPASFPAGWMDTLPTTEAFRYVRMPAGVLPPYKQALFGITGVRLPVATQFYPYSLEPVVYTGQATVRLGEDPNRGQTTVRVNTFENRIETASVTVRLRMPIYYDASVAVRLRLMGSGLVFDTGTVGVRLTLAGTFE
jgi:hypothetical protein